MKQPRFLKKDGKTDWIDDYAAEYSVERFNGAMAFTIGKYYRRLGKKDPEEMERYKIEDYTARWVGKLVDVYGYSFTRAFNDVQRELRQAKALASEE